MGTFSGSGPPPDFDAGMPVYQHDSLTPMGQIEQLGRLAQGPSGPLRGWRRAVVIAGVVLLGLVGAAMMAAWLATR